MGTLFVVSTPIGNLEDITIRAIKTLLIADIVACEDTRRTGQLLKIIQANYEVFVATPKNPSQRLVSYYDEIELKRAPELLEELEMGKSVALVSDAGTPLINDPGFLLVREASRRGIPVISIPGPSAIIAALTSSGLPASSFLYLGYPPEKSGRRIDLFTRLISVQTSIEPTIIFYCSPHHLAEVLEDMRQVFGDITITIARELTKIHESVWSGTISAATQNPELQMGELVLLLRLPQPTP